MQPNLFFSVLLALALGFAFGALMLLLVFLIGKVTRKPWVLRMLPALFAGAGWVLVLRFMGPLQDLLARLAYRHDLHKLVILGLLAAALAVGLRLSVLTLRGDRSRD